MAEETAAALTISQRIQAVKIIAEQINKGNSGLTAEVWQTKVPKEGVGASVFQDGQKFAVVTVNGKGYLTLRSFLEGTPPENIAKLEKFGFTPGKFTLPVASYDGPGKKFDSSLLAKAN
jgi:hypothetical protein